MRAAALVALAAALALSACGGGTSGSDDAKRAADALSADNSAKDLAASLRKRGHTVSGITCTDVSAKRQRCAGAVDGDPVRWRVDIDLATRTRDFVVTP